MVVLVGGKKLACSSDVNVVRVCSLRVACASDLGGIILVDLKKDNFGKGELTKAKLVEETIRFRTV